MHTRFPFGALALAALGATAVSCSDDPTDPYVSAPLNQSDRSPSAGAVAAGGSGAADDQVAMGGSGLGGSGLGGSGMAGSGMAGSGMAAGGSGTGGSGMAAGGSDLSVDDEPCDAVSDVFQVSCAGASCHEAPTLGNFALGQAEAEALVDQPVILNGGCGSFIDSANPLDSVILTKTNSPPACGQPMPPSGSPISATQRECLISWLGQFE